MFDVQRAREAGPACQPQMDTAAVRGTLAAMPLSLRRRWRRVHVFVFGFIGCALPLAGVVPVAVSPPASTGAGGVLTLALGLEQNVIPPGQFLLGATPQGRISYVRLTDGTTRVFWGGT